MTWNSGRLHMMHPDSCPICGTEPYPAGSCDGCGFTRTPDAEHGLLSENNLPALIWAGACWFLAVSAILGLIFRAILG